MDNTITLSYHHNDNITLVAYLSHSGYHILVITLSRSGDNLMDVSAWSSHSTVCAIANTLICILLHPRNVIFADIICCHHLLTSFADIICWHHRDVISADVSILFCDHGRINSVPLNKGSMHTSTHGHFFHQIRHSPPLSRCYQCHDQWWHRVKHVDLCPLELFHFLIWHKCWLNQIVYVTPSWMFHNCVPSFFKTD